MITDVELANDVFADQNDYLLYLAEGAWDEHPERKRIKYVKLFRDPAPKGHPTATWLHSGEIRLYRVKSGRLYCIGRRNYRAIDEAIAAGEVIERTLTFDEALKEWKMGPLQRRMA